MYGILWSIKKILQSIQGSHEVYKFFYGAYNGSYEVNKTSYKEFMGS